MDSPAAVNRSEIDISNLRDKRFETVAAILLAVLAAILSLNDLASGKFEGDQLIASAIVLGALSLVFHQPGPKYAFFWGMLIAGSIGTAIAAYAINAALKFA